MNWQTRSLLMCCVCLMLMPIRAQAKDSRKLNLLLIITDEHNFRTLGCYREQLAAEQALMWGPEAVVETPHIDTIARCGTLFNRMYGSAPVCTPSRGSMFTGMYPHTLGVPNNSARPGDGKYLKAEVTTIAEVLRDAGYMTGYSGKWHLAENTNKKEFWAPYPVGSPGHNYGFQDNKYMFNGGHDKFKGIDPNGQPYRAAKQPQRIGTDSAGQPVYEDKRAKNVKFTTDWLADRTLEFIGKHKDKPFFYVVSIPDPHTPNAVRAPYDTMYQDIEVRLPRTFESTPKVKSKGVPEWRTRSKTDNREKLIRDIRQYFGMVKCIDDNVGRILQKLAEEQILESTIVVFASDHGDLLGEHGRVNKGTIHEASAKIPFVLAHGKEVASPRIPRGKVVDLAGNTTDWMPTFLRLLDVECPPVAGRDLTPLLAKKAPDDWNDVTFIRKGFFAAVTSRHKLFVQSQGQPWLLDIQADPDENQNFIDDPAYTDVAKRLARELKGYMQQNNDPNQAVTAKLDMIISQ